MKCLFPTCNQSSRLQASMQARRHALRGPRGGRRHREPARDKALRDPSARRVLSQCNQPLIPSRPWLPSFLLNTIIFYHTHHHQRVFSNTTTTTTAYSPLGRLAECRLLLPRPHRRPRYLRRDCWALPPPLPRVHLLADALPTSSSSSRPPLIYVAASNPSINRHQHFYYHPYYSYRHMNGSSRASASAEARFKSPLRQNGFSIASSSTDSLGNPNQHYLSRSRTSTGSTVTLREHAVGMSANGNHHLKPEAAGGGVGDDGDVEMMDEVSVCACPTCSEGSSSPSCSSQRSHHHQFAHSPSHEPTSPARLEARRLPTRQATSPRHPMASYDDPRSPRRPPHPRRPRLPSGYPASAPASEARHAWARIQATPTGRHPTRSLTSTMAEAATLTRLSSLTSAHPSRRQQSARAAQQWTTTMTLTRTSLATQLRSLASKTHPHTLAGAQREELRRP